MRNKRFILAAVLIAGATFAAGCGGCQQGGGTGGGQGMQQEQPQTYGAPGGTEPRKQQGGGTGGAGGQMQEQQRDGGTGCPPSGTQDRRRQGYGTETDTSTAWPGTCDAAGGGTGGAAGQEQQQQQPGGAAGAPDQQQQQQGGAGTDGAAQGQAGGGTGGAAGAGAGIGAGAAGGEGGGAGGGDDKRKKIEDRYPLVRLGAGYSWLYTPGLSDISNIPGSKVSKGGESFMLQTLLGPMPLLPGVYWGLEAGYQRLYHYDLGEVNEAEANLKSIPVLVLWELPFETEGSIVPLLQWGVGAEFTNGDAQALNASEKDNHTDLALAVGPGFAVDLNESLELTTLLKYYYYLTRNTDTSLLNLSVNLGFNM